MSSDGTITRMVGMLKRGDRAASQHLWEAYFGRLVGLARGRLRGRVRVTADEEDVALSAFDSFFRRAARRDFPQLHDRNDLWQLLFVLTVRKAINLVHHHGAKSRGERRSTEPRRPGRPRGGGDHGIGASPELAAQMAEQCRNLLDRLADESLRAVALWKMEGYTNREIASKLGCVEQTVERKLRSIRQVWSCEVAS